MTTPYYTDQKAKDGIDAILHANARVRQNLGNNSTREELQRAKEVERINLLSVRELDPEKIDRLISDD
jgi:hypothetical protein